MNIIFVLLLDLYRAWRRLMTTTTTTTKQQEVATASSSRRKSLQSRLRHDKRHDKRVKSRVVKKFGPKQFPNDKCCDSWVQQLAVAIPPFFVLPVSTYLLADSKNVISCPNTAACDPNNREGRTSSVNDFLKSKRCKAVRVSAIK